MMTLFLLFAVQLFAICQASFDKNEKSAEAIMTDYMKLKSYAASLKSENDNLKDDNQKLERNILEQKSRADKMENDYLIFVSESFNSAERVQIENLKKENNNLKENSLDIEFQNEEKIFPPKTRYRDVCAICLSDFRDRDSWACLIDNEHHVVCEQYHVFHSECLYEHMSSDNRECPICRNQYTMFATFPHPFATDKHNPALFNRAFNKNKPILRTTAISMIKPFVTVPEGEDCYDAIHEIMPTGNKLSYSKFQKFNELLVKICKKDGHNLYIDKNLPEFQIVKYFQEEMKSEAKNHKMSADYSKIVAAAVREFLIYLPFAILSFVFPYFIDALFATNIVVGFEKRGIFEAIVLTTGLATGMLMYIAIVRPIIMKVYQSNRTLLNSFSKLN